MAYHAVVHQRGRVGYTGADPTAAAGNVA
jgi:hypothetical protein